MQYSGNDILRIKQRNIGFVLFCLGTRAEFGIPKKERKTTNHARVVFHPFAWTRPIAFLFAVCADVADIITLVKFYVYRFRGFGVLTPLIFPISIDLAGHPYNSATL